MLDTPSLLGMYAVSTVTMLITYYITFGDCNFRISPLDLKSDEETYIK